MTYVFISEVYIVRVEATGIVQEMLTDLNEGVHACGLDYAGFV